MIGDPTEGALVVLAAKGGFDVDGYARRSPPRRDLPFDTDYKLMATFHRMKDETGRDVVRCFVKGAPDQVLARATDDARPDDLQPVAIDDAMQRALPRRERAPRRAGPARAGDGAARTSTRRPFDPNADLLGYMQELTRADARRHRRPAAADGQGRDRQGEGSRDPGADDHRRPRGHRRGDREPARASRAARSPAPSSPR